jgi:broad specificity phosphatase PhoE
MIAHLIRHGEKAPGSGDRGLSPAGAAQADRTGRSLAGRKVDALYASPLKRTMETAEGIARHIGLSAVVTAEVRERLIYGDRPGETPEEYVVLFDKTSRERDYTPPNGDSSRAAGERLKRFLRDRWQERPDGEIVVATHGAIITDMLLNDFTAEELNAMVPGCLAYPNCGITTVEFDGERLTIRRLADVSHLGESVKHSAFA